MAGLWGRQECLPHQLLLLYAALPDCCYNCITLLAPDIFNTREPTSEKGKRTYRTIHDRLAALYPPIYLEGHIAAEDDKLPKVANEKAKEIAKCQDDISKGACKDPSTPLSTLEAKDSTLDGVNFVADDAKRLIAALDKVIDTSSNKVFASMKEDPDHWGLKASFAATIGTGYREIWREAPYESPASKAAGKEPGQMDSMMSMRFGNAGSKIRFTALHCAVDERTSKCNIHIDEAGFVLGLPKGFSLTPDLYGHIINELKFKTDFRDWLVGLTDNRTAKKIFAEVIRRVSINFANAANGYAGLDKKINSIKGGRDPLYYGVQAAKILAPTGVTVDLYDNDKFKVQVTGSYINDDLSVTLTVGGSW